MPDEKSTGEQIIGDALYHGRNRTLQELAFSNLIERRLDAEGGAVLEDYLIYCIDANEINITWPYEGAIDLFLIVGLLSPNGLGKICWGGDQEWEDINVDGGYTDEFVACRVANNTAIVVGQSEEIQRLISPLGVDFAQMNTGGTKNLLCVEFANDVWLTGGQSGRILKSINNGINWADKTIPGEAAVIAKFAYGNGKWIAVLTDYYYFSIDNGETWQYGGTYPCNPGGTEAHAFDVVFDGEQFVFVGYELNPMFPAGRGYIARSENGSVLTPDLIESKSDFPLNSAFFAFSIVYKNGIHAILGNSEGLFYSLDGAKTWYWRGCPLADQDFGYGGTRKVTFFRGCLWIAGRPYLDPGVGVKSIARLYRTQRLY